MGVLNKKPQQHHVWKEEESTAAQRPGRCCSQTGNNKNNNNTDEPYVLDKRETHCDVFSLLVSFHGVKLIVYFLVSDGSVSRPGP